MFNNCAAIEVNNSQIKIDTVSVTTISCVPTPKLFIDSKMLQHPKSKLIEVTYRISHFPAPRECFAIYIIWNRSRSREKKSMLNYFDLQMIAWGSLPAPKNVKSLTRSSYKHGMLNVHKFLLVTCNFFFNVCIVFCWHQRSEKNSFIWIPFSVCDYIIRIASASARSLVQHRRRMRARMSIALLHCQCQFCDTVLASTVRLCSWNILNNFCHWTTRTLTNLEFSFSRISWHVINIAWIYCLCRCFMVSSSHHSQNGMGNCESRQHSKLETI